MNLPRLDPDDDGNEHLHALLRRVHPDDVQAFVEKLTNQPIRDRFHTYRELLIGVHFRDQGFDVRYERRVGHRTPDWCLADKDNTPVEIVDVLTLHQRYEKDVEISKAIGTSGLWTGWITVPLDHIYRKLNDKAGQYSKLANELSMPFVLAVYGEFIASIAPEEMEHILFVQHGGWFISNAEVSGLIYCRDKNFQFEYTYYVNPHAAHQSSLLSLQLPANS